MIFLCEHETQGIAYQQALSMNIPILAWDHGGFWQDPEFYPQRVNFSPVTSVPYWSDQCGLRFKNITTFAKSLDQFVKNLNKKKFKPRKYVYENLNLKLSAKKYLDIYLDCKNTQ